jgi:cobalt/nickel transport system permease protein
MHIPDGYLGPETIAAGWALTVPIWYRANRRTKKLLSQPRMIPVLAFGAAFSFLVMMLNVPVAGGTTAHAVGAVLVAVIAGPEVACLAVSAALVIQALFFGDGGILTLGVNCLNMAVVMPYAGYAVYRLLAGRSALGSSRRLYAAGIGAWCGLVAAAALAGLELGIQPLLHSVDGVAQYAPYGLRTTLIAMVGSHALIVGPVEAAFTVAVFAVLRRQSPELFAAAATALRPRRRRLVALLAVFVAAVPLGLFAGGGAFAEWNGGELARRLGYMPRGFARLGGHWSGLLPGYGRPGAGGAWAVFWYLVSALVGVALIAAAVWLVVTLRRRAPRSQVQSPPPSPGAVASPSSPERQPAQSASPAGRAARPRRLFSEHLVVTLATWVEHAVASDELARRPGLLQRLDPRVKLVSLLACVVVAALSTRLLVLAVLLAFAVGLVAASRLGLARFAARAWLFIPLFTALVMLPVTLSIVSPGHAVLTLWSHGAPFWPLPTALTVTAPGLLAFLRLVARVTTVVSFGVLLTLTTPWADLLKALRAVGVPRGFVFVLAVAYRYVFTLVRVVQDMALARTSRLVGRAAAGEDRRFLGAAVAATFGKSQATSEQVYLAMISRGYSGEVRTLSTWRLRRLDVVWTCAVSAGLAVLLWFALVAGPR